MSFVHGSVLALGRRERGLVTPLTRGNYRPSSDPNRLSFALALY
jgi:hypothetical protein